VVLRFVLVFVGAGLGGVARFGFGPLVQRLTRRLFPWGTLAVNVTGCFAMGVLAALAGAAGRLSDRVLLTAGASAAAAGCAVVAAAPNAPLALAGFALAGGGISLNAPVIFGAAGRRRADAASAVATVTTLAYLGFFIGPPLLGGLAQADGLRFAFAVLSVIAAAVAVVATRLRIGGDPEPRSQETP